MQVPFPTRNNVFQRTASADITNTTARPTSTTRLHDQHTTRQKAATTSAASSIIDWGQNRHATTRHDAGDANDASQSPSGPLFRRRAAAAAADAERCMMGGGGSGRGRDEGAPPLVLYHFLSPGRAEDAGCGAGRRRVE